MKKAIRVGIVLALWTPVLFLAGQRAFGAGGADFAGFDMNAKATAMQFTLDSPSLGVPAEPTGEFNIAFSQTTLQSGPSAYGLGSIAWPGQVAAALPSFLQSEIERQSGQKLPANLPNYPVRAESFFPQGPQEASTDAGTVHMHSAAHDTSSEANSSLNAFTMPVVGHIGQQTSMSSSGFDPSGAVSMAESEANGISLLSGAITIDAVTSTLTARSDGEKGTVAGTTTVSGAEIKGVGRVAIDSSGVHVINQGIDSAAAQQSLNQVLNQLGVSMELAAPIDTIQGAKASRTLGGLLVRIDASNLDKVVSALPDPIEQQLRAQLPFSFDQVFTLSLAPAAVTAGAAKAVSFSVPPVTNVLPSSVTAPSTETTTTPPSTDLGPQAIAPAAGAPATVLQPVVVASYKGVPVWLVVLLVIAAFVLSRPMMMAADRLLAVAGAGKACPDEKD